MINLLVNILFLFFGFLGLILIVIGIWRLKKTEIEHKKVSNDDFLSESEKITQNRTIKILIAGLLLMVISTITSILTMIVNFIRLYNS